MTRSWRFLGLLTALLISTAEAQTVPDLNQHGLTGSWYQPATSGQGFEVEVFPDLLAPGTGLAQVSWFTFDTVVGGPERERWYTLSGPVMTGQRNAALTIYQNTGGNFNAPPATTGQAVGTATLSFDTCSSGQLAYTFTDGSGRMGNIRLTRLTQNVTCSTTTPYPTNADFAFSGNWYNSATSGQGFTAEVNPNSGQFFSAWYTYMPNGAAAGAAGQRWYTAQGNFTPGQRSIPVTIHETIGGLFDTPTDPLPQTVNVGFGMMAFRSCSAATFSYIVSGVSSSGVSGTIPLSRVGPVPPGCVPPPVTYEFTTVDFPEAANTLIWGIVDTDGTGVELVGHHYEGPADTYSNDVPFLVNLTDGVSTFTTLPLPPGTVGAEPHGINAAGTIVGGAIDGAGSISAFILDSGRKFTVFSNPGWADTEARGISSTGLVTGDSLGLNSGPASSGFIYDPEQNSFTPILPRAGPNADTVAQGINAGGLVVGHVQMPGTRFGWLRHPNGDMTFFQVNGLPTNARGINDSGQIAGYVTVDRTAGTHKGFVITLSGAPGFEAVTIPDTELLEFPGATSTFVEGITKTGAIAGFWDSDGQTGHGFIGTPSPGTY